MKKSVFGLLLLICGCAAPGTPLTATGGPGHLVSPSPIGPGEGYLFISWQDTARYIDRPAFVYGRVVKTANIGSRCFLNFHEDYRKHFTVVINQGSFACFPQPPDELYDGKHVVVQGWIHGEMGKPEMIVSSPRQVMVVSADEDEALALVRKHHPQVKTGREIEAKRGTILETDSIRIGTYNVLNLFDEFDDPYHADEVMIPKPREELENIAQQIRRLDADVLALQEVENRFYLEKFVRAFLPDMAYEYIALLESHSHRGIDVAVLSRFPIGPVTTYQHLRFQGADGEMHRFQRDFLQVHVMAPGDFAFDVFAVHLKSKYGGAAQSEPIRQAEANKIREIVDELLQRDPHAKFVICGDFNDYWDSPSLRVIRGSGPTELTCPGTGLPESLRITYNREPYLSMIDFIVCSPEMQRRFVSESYQVLPGSVEETGSDHNPSVAAFKID